MIDNYDMKIFKKDIDKNILQMYNGYRDEQEQFGTKHYAELWNEKNIYN